MKKAPLAVMNPEALVKGMVCESVQMTYADTGSPIMFETEKFLLECEPLNKAAPIWEWLVDFDNHKMKLAGDPKEGQADDGYSPIDLETAVSMMGQKIQEIGMEPFQCFLESLKDGWNKPNGPEKSPDGPTPSAPAKPQNPHQ